MILKIGGSESLSSYNDGMKSPAMRATGKKWEHAVNMKSLSRDRWESSVTGHEIEALGQGRGLLR